MQMNKIVSLLAVSPLMAFAAEYTWQGAANSYWDLTSLNWLQGETVSAFVWSVGMRE